MTKHLRHVGGPGRSEVAQHELLERRAHLRRQKARSKQNRVISAARAILRSAIAKRDGMKKAK